MRGPWTQNYCTKSITSQNKRRRRQQTLKKAAVKMNMCMARRALVWISMMTMTMTITMTMTMIPTVAAAGSLSSSSLSWWGVLREFCIGVKVGCLHTARAMRLFAPRIFGTPAKENGDDFSNSLKVLAVGYGRTGTYSLSLALEELGYPTLHTQHMYEHEEILKMWDDEIFRPSVQSGKVIMGKPKLSTITKAGFQATTDLPMALYYEQVMEEYPDCKFILTTRENSQVWFQSFSALIKSISVPARYLGLFFAHVQRMDHYIRWLTAVVNQDDSYLTTPLPLPDPNNRALIASYEEHNRRVRQVIPPERLLEYSVKQGWQPLCDFLQVEHCPLEKPFPRTNSLLSVQTQSIAAFFPPIVAIVGLLVYFTRSQTERKGQGFHKKLD